MERYNEVNSKESEKTKYRTNTLWRNPNSDYKEDAVYLLVDFCDYYEKSKREKRYIAIELTSGERWRDPKKHIGEAVKDLEPFYGEVTLGQKV